VIAAGYNMTATAGEKRVQPSARRERKRRRRSDSGSPLWPLVLKSVLQKHVKCGALRKLYNGLSTTPQGSLSCTGESTQDASRTL
jgi:hypothetical protein